MKCISLTQSGKKCSREAFPGEYRCAQHHNMHYNKILSFGVSEETLEKEFNLVLNTASFFDIFRYSHAYFFNLNTSYYKQKYLDIAVNNNHIFNENTITELQNCIFSTDMFDIVKIPLLTWNDTQQKSGNKSILQHIMFLTCLLDILKISIYLCIQKKMNLTWDLIRIYKECRTELKQTKDQWREENINKLRIKEVGKSGVMCDDVFKYIFVNYM